MSCNWNNFNDDELMDLGKIVVEWAVRDYFNPRIKAEVIFDMLLSEEVTKLIAEMLNVDEKEVKLLAKEFPIDNGINDNTNNPVDYLVSYEDTLYLVELKTTAGSFDEKQFLNYMKFVGKCPTKKLEDRESLFELFKKICSDRDNISNNRILIAKGENDKGNNGKRNNAYALKQSEKYLFQLNWMQQILQLKKNDNDNNLKDIILNSEEDIGHFLYSLENEWSSYKIKLIYISLDPIGKEKNATIKEKEDPIKNADVYNIVLDEQKCQTENTYFYNIYGEKILTSFTKRISPAIKMIQTIPNIILEKGELQEKRISKKEVNSYEHET